MLYRQLRYYLNLSAIYYSIWGMAKDDRDTELWLDAALEYWLLKNKADERDALPTVLPVAMFRAHQYTGGR